MSIRLKITDYPIGYSDLLPEGICGILEDSAPVVLKLKPKKASRLLPHSTCITSKIKTLKRLKIDPVDLEYSSDLGGILMRPTIELGVTSPKKHAPRKEPLQAASTKASPSSRSSNISDLEINYDNLNLPKHVLDLDTSNTVEVTEGLLQRIARQTERRTKALGNLLLSSTAPSIIAHAAAINYVSAVMEDSFDIEFEEDPSIGEAVRDITKLEVLEFFTQHLKVPKHRKEAIMSAFVEKLTTKTVDRMEKALTQNNQENRIKALEAVLVSRSKVKGDGQPPSGSIRRSSEQPDKERVLQRPMITPPDRKSTRI